MMRNNRTRTEIGFTLVEVIVGMFIGMITVLVIMNTIANSEAVRRNVSSGSDSTTVGSLAAQTIQRELLNAGFASAIDTELFTICSANGISAYNSNRTPNGVTLGADEFRPVRIIPWDDGASPYPAPDTDTDIIQVTASGTSTFLGKGVDIQSTLSTSTDFIITTSTSRAGLRMGDLIVAVPCAAVPSSTTACAPDGAKACVISQITDIPMTSGNLNECNIAKAVGDTDRIVRHASGNFRNAYENCNSVPSAWNKPGDPNLGIDYSGAKIYSLGSPERFVIRAYAIRNGNLTVCNPIQQNCDTLTEWQIVAENIVSLRAQYGYDADASGDIAAAEWVRTLPASPVWNQLKTIRFALVARGNQLERDTTTDDCTPDWAGNANANATCTGTAQAAEVFLRSAPDGANWARYRYKVFQTTTPMRNLFWSDNL